MGGRVVVVGGDPLGPARPGVAWCWGAGGVCVCVFVDPFRVLHFVLFSPSLFRFFRFYIFIYIHTHVHLFYFLFFSDLFKVVILAIAQYVPLV